MGDTATNAGALAHYNSNTRQGYRLWVHLGSTVNTMSGDASDSAFANFRMAVSNNASDSDLDELGVTAWGSWYTANVAGVSGARANVRLSVMDLRAP